MKTLRSLPGRILRKVVTPVYYSEKILIQQGLISTTNLVLPDFLCIGVQKTGTSWLHKNLQRQPAIFMPDRKELDYFGNSYRLYSYPLSYYSDYFSQAQSKVKGEASPYCDLPIERIRFIYKIMPRLKLIIILRNPVDRLWSAGLMHLVRGRQRKFEEIPTSEFEDFLERKENLKQGNYPELLKNWRTLFSNEQLLVLFYEDLVRDSEHVLQTVLHFLGTEYNAEAFLKERLNESPKHPMPVHLRNHFLKIYKPSILELSKEFGEKALIWLKVNESLTES